MTPKNTGERSKREQVIGIVIVSAMLLLGTTIAGAQTKVREVSVVDDMKQPVMSHVELTSPDGTSHTIDDTGPDGVLRQAFTCPAHAKVVAEPLTHIYRKSLPQLCKTTIAILVWSPTTTQTLFAGAQSEASRGRNGVAALLYNEVYQRSLGADPATAQAAQEKAVVYTAKALNVAPPNAPDPIQGRIVPTTGLVTALTKYQRQNGLEVTAKIDAATLQSLAGTTVAPFIAKAQ